jgi:hypothetical protein
MCQARQARQPNGGMTKITVEEAVGTRLAHDITEIRPGEFKGPSFRRGTRFRSRMSAGSCAWVSGTYMSWT